MNYTNHDCNSADSKRNFYAETHLYELRRKMYESFYGDDFTIDGKAFLEEFASMPRAESEPDLGKFFESLKLSDNPCDKAVAEIHTNGVARQVTNKEAELTPIELADLSNYTKAQRNGIERIEAVIDFIDIAFKPSKPYSSREALKTALTKVCKVSYFVKDLGDGTYSIRLHDVKNKKDLIKRFQAISSITGTVDIDQLEITCIERAIDFYFEDEPKAELAFALYRSMRLPHDTDNIRLYRTKEDKKGKITADRNEVIKRLNDGWNIGIGDKRFDDIYWHIYIKKTDTLKRVPQTLPSDEWRVRCEMTVQRKELLNLLQSELPSVTAVTVGNLDKLIMGMSKETKFTKRKDSVANNCLKNIPNNFKIHTRPVGREAEVTFNSKRASKPRLSRTVKTHSEFNQLIKEPQRNLARGFKAESKSEPKFAF